MKLSFYQQPRACSDDCMMAFYVVSVQFPSSSIKLPSIFRRYFSYMYQHQHVSPEKITKQQQKNRMFWGGNGESGGCFKNVSRQLHAAIGKPRGSPLRFLNTSAVIRYLICVYASHFFARRPYHFNLTLRTANKF